MIAFFPVYVTKAAIFEILKEIEFEAHTDFFWGQNSARINQ